jgi:asparagine synthase (glutamine-hydrolysing)
MCRIAGKISKTEVADFKDNLKEMLKAMAHGGPDDEGIYIEGQVALGHRRLSIIDLSKAGHQPMLSENRDLVISFNGEIYNYLELKKELEANGFLFHTATDTEVILNAYRFWGVKSFIRLEGIFAFALYDKEQHLFYLVSDHIGVKPIYYALDDHELLFSSEVRAFKTVNHHWKENEDWKILFLAFGSIPHPFTTFSEVAQLPPGHYLKLDIRNFQHQFVCYYGINELEYSIHSKEEALVQIQFSLQKAIRKNLISDAPLGVFLSGGIDSSLITLLTDQLLPNFRTLSVNFDDALYDEHFYQQLVLEKTENVEHTSHRVTEHMFWQCLDDIWKAMDQPSIDAVNAYFVARFAKIEGIRAVLSGIGADEVFGGYASFKRIKWMRLIRRLPFKNRVGKFLSRFKNSWGRLVYLQLPGVIGDYLFLRGIFTPAEIARQLKVQERKVWSVLEQVPFAHPQQTNDIEYAALLEKNVYMRNQLLKDTDYMGMWHGVEVRVPFLDVELLKKVLSIPPSIRYVTGWPKYLLTASHQDLLPHKIIFRKKKGFTFPFSIWMHHSAKRFRALMPEGIETDAVAHEFAHGRCHWSKCWSLAVLNQFK